MLERALRQLAPAVRATGRPVDIIVVDNDGGSDGSSDGVGRVVDAFRDASGSSVRLFVERQPGIAHAREAVFREAVAIGARWLAMLDDDEWPDANWLVDLLATAESTGATVVGGPVRPVFPRQAAHLERYARYWSVERQVVHGKTLVYASGNFMIDLGAIAALPRPLFDSAFGLTGGEDVVFFRRLFVAGHTMAWSDSAVIHEEVPIERASLAWMRGRRVALGSTAVRWECLEDGSRALVKTLGLTARLLVYPMLRREPESPLVGWLLEACKVRGRYAAQFGRERVPYARTVSTDGRSR